MMEKTIALPPASTTLPGALAAGPVSRSPDARRPLFATRAQRLSTGPAPAALIVLVWMLLWAWVSLGVMAPLSRVGAPGQAAQQTSLRA